MEVNINEVRFGDLNIGTGKSTPYQIEIPGETITIPAVLDEVGVIIQEERQEQLPSTYETHFKWYYPVRMRLIPCQGEIGNYIEIGGPERTLINDILGFVSVLETDIVIEGSDDGAEPSIVILGQQVMQWVGLKMAQYKNNWKNKLATANIN